MYRPVHIDTLMGLRSVGSRSKYAAYANAFKLDMHEMACMTYLTSSSLPKVHFTWWSPILCTLLSPPWSSLHCWPWQATSYLGERVWGRAKILRIFRCSINAMQQITDEDGRVLTHDYSMLLHKLRHTYYKPYFSLHIALLIKNEAIL